uniref:Uncharacterized protein n=1 Tax=Picea sitchensis TaxID=3332 RepID=A0A6B9XTM9_PICSI|nr:hypothetical protein Q903MT_gene5457 [Picea sitchensis]
MKYNLGGNTPKVGFSLCRCPILSLSSPKSTSLFAATLFFLFFAWVSFSLYGCLILSLSMLGSAFLSVAFFFLYGTATTLLIASHDVSCLSLILYTSYGPVVTLSSFNIQVHKTKTCLVTCLFHILCGK